MLESGVLETGFVLESWLLEPLACLNGECKNRTARVGANARIAYVDVGRQAGRQVATWTTGQIAYTALNLYFGKILCDNNTQNSSTRSEIKTERKAVQGQFPPCFRPLPFRRARGVSEAAASAARMGAAWRFWLVQVGIRESGGCSLALLLYIQLRTAR